MKKKWLKIKNQNNSILANLEHAHIKKQETQLLYKNITKFDNFINPEGDEKIKIDSFIEMFSTLSLEDKVKEAINLLDNPNIYMKYYVRNCAELANILILVKKVIKEEDKVEETDSTIILIKKHL